ncbi:hypothetical protein SAMN02745181_1072 [Rubritalea squalenifaciens DSM 18772]|uniref:Uncharacterized protein n=2 Tax=Rubritalea TaxID=361050 RepID=A0A1M6EMN5_9BACT|nr:hypothetical protein [Rubritalea squalenifaciens]SHI86797.1 hypothetical protein SAMN02745181_1072 [Rubritalea squalenifaciens DSM 18772]
MYRLIGLILLALGFASSYFGLPGLLIAVLFWVLGTFFFARSFLKK